MNFWRLSLFHQVWHIPEGGLLQPQNEPHAMFAAHGDKVTIVKFHPLAKDIILTASFDRTVRMWNLANTDNHVIDLDVSGHDSASSSCACFLSSEF